MKIKNFIALSLVLFLHNLFAADKMEDSEYRAKCYQAEDQFIDTTNDFLSLLKDCRSNLENVSVMTVSMVDNVKKHTKATIKRFEGLEKNLQLLKSARVFSNHGIHANFFSKDNDHVSTFLGIIHGVLKEMVSSEYGDRVYDFEEYTQGYDGFKKILLCLKSEEILFALNAIKCCREILDDKSISEKIDAFISSKITSEQHVVLYFKLLKGYILGQTHKIPHFSLCYLSDLNKNPYQKMLGNFTLVSNKKGGSAKERLAQKAQHLEREKNLKLSDEFELVQRPILEQYYREALKSLMLLGYAKEADIKKYRELGDKTPQDIIVSPIEAPAVTSVSSIADFVFDVSLPSSASDDEEVGEDFADHMLVSIAAEEKTAHQRPEGLDSQPDSVEEDAVCAEILAEMELAKVQHGLDRQKKFTQPKSGKEPVQFALPVVQTEVNALMGSQRIKRLHAFWNNPVLSWNRFVKVLEQLGGALQEDTGSSHCKFIFFNCAKALGVYRPHKFGTSNVGLHQLQDVRNFLLENNLAKKPQ